MSLKKILILGSLLLSVTAYGQTKKLSLLRDQLLDDYWQFKKDSLPGAEQTDFPDNNWRTIHLPHDWAIEDLPGQNDSTIIGPFYKYSPAQEHGAYVVGGTAWYRKSFTLPPLAGQTVAIHFEGVYMHADVWINGHLLGSHPYGYTPFTYDLTPYLAAPGKKNIVAVRVKNEGLNTRWYTGAGIYRHVHLQVLPATHLIKDSTFITFPEAGKQQAIVQVTTAVTGNSHTHKILEISLKDSAGQVVATAAQPVLLNGTAPVTVVKQLTVSNPLLWSPTRPYLYTTAIRLLDTLQTDKPVHSDELTYQTGIRRISISANKGFLLNGERILLKGGCLHHDNGLLGAAAFDRAEERKVELMKANGFNAIRTSHNPPSEKFLEACDRLGMLVIDEMFDVWTEQKLPQDYHLSFNEWWERDLRSIVLRDRNHPSVIMWSIGNEIPERADKNGLAIAREMIQTIHRYDTTHAITAGVPEFWERPYKWSAADPLFAMLDVAGYNYQWQNYALDARRVPGRVIMGTETFPSQLYDSWNQVQGLPYVIGDFVWTAMDYLGEAGIGHQTYTGSGIGRRTFPWINANCGDIDLIGNKNPQSYYRDVVWRNSPVEILVHTPVSKGKKEKVSRWGWPEESDSWNWAGMNDTIMQVRVFTRGKKIDLILNDFRVATKEVPNDTPLTVTFNVPYKPGVLTAFAYDAKGNETGFRSIATTNPPVAIRLKADHTKIPAGNGSLVYVQVEIVDDLDRIVPTANLPLELTISGEGSLAGAGNACPDCPASFQQLNIKSHQGRALVILRANEHPGDITLQAKNTGLKKAKISIKTQRI